MAAQNFSITYLDGSQAVGAYIKDNLSIGGTTVRALQMGLARRTVRGTGILGVGYAANEAAKVPYPNIIDEMVRQELIETRAFSLWLNSRQSPSGSILFGGIDADKFIGELSVLPILPQSGSDGYLAYQIDMSSLSVSLANGTDEKIDTSSRSLPAVLDSGTTLSYLPEAMASQLFGAVGAYTDEGGTGLTFISCKYLRQDAGMTMRFGFGGADGRRKDEAVIQVPAHEMVLDVLTGHEWELPDSIPFSDACLFGVQRTTALRQGASNGIPETAPLALLGDTFLRSAYVVYDQTHNQIGLAPANWNSTGSNIVELDAGATGLPQVTGVIWQEVTGSASSTPSSMEENAAGPRSRAPGLDVLLTLVVASACAMLSATSFML